MKRKARAAAAALSFLALLAAPGVGITGEREEQWWKQAESEAAREEYRLIAAEELRGLCGSDSDAILLDVRPAYEFREGHLPRALNFEIDLGDRLAIDRAKKEAMEMLLGRDKSRPVVIYCRNFR